MRVTASTALILACLAAAPVAAQSIRGKLLDADTRQPIVTAEVTLLHGESGLRSAASFTTDSTGAFLLRARQAGWYRLRARRIGYQEVISPSVSLGLGVPMEVELVMSASAVPLAPLTVLARTAPAGNLRLVTSGFYERRKTWGREGLGMGTFLDGADLDKHGYSKVSEVLQEVPGVHVGGCGGRNVCITMRPSTLLLAPKPPGIGFVKEGYRKDSTPFQGCTPSIYLDGQLLRLANESIDDLMTAWSLAAVEVYPSINRPAEFANVVEEPCGAVALWTGGRDRESRARDARSDSTRKH